MIIISFSGLDGSGKSTQAKKTIECLEKSGGKVYYFHATNFSLPQRIKSLAKNRGQGHSSIDRAKTSASRFGIFMRKAVLPIDLLRFKFLLWNIKKKGYTSLVSDRYFYDTLINIAYLSGSQRLMRAPIRRPDICFYINTGVKAIMARERQPEQGLTYLKNKKMLYDKFAEELGMVVIDGNRDIKAISEDINRHLEKII